MHHFAEKNIRKMQKNAVLLLLILILFIFSPVWPPRKALLHSNLRHRDLEFVQCGIALQAAANMT